VRLVGLEPSCLAVLRHDALGLLGPDDEAARAVAGAASTLAEALAGAPGWVPPDLGGLRVLAQPHCHQHAVMGWEADRALLTRAGAEVTAVGGCCGLAGNFGAERGHHEVSVAVAGTALLPALEAAGPETVLLADGFSCRTQLDHLAGREALHLAQLLAEPEPGPPPRSINR
jgi:Fe-S oxidoreductase